MTNIDWSIYTDEQLVEAQTEIGQEQSRRYVVNSIPEQMVALNEQYLDATGVESGQAWVQPTGAHDAYPKDWIVIHAGGQWVSLVDANVWEPGVANWRADSGEEYPDWVQPTGSHDAYSTGAKVSHVDKHWTSDVDANVWEPGVYGWTEVVE